MDNPPAAARNPTSTFQPLAPVGKTEAPSQRANAVGGQWFLGHGLSEEGHRDQAVVSPMEGEEGWEDTGS